MAPRHLHLLAFLALAACDEVITIPPGRPEPVEPQELAAGEYIVTVEEVAAAACDGMAPREIIGQQIGAELRIGGELVVFELGGMRLEGDMIPGAIFVEGSESAVDYGEDDEEVPPAEDVDVDEPGASDREESGEVGYEEEESPCGEERPDDPPEERPDYEAYAALDAQILAPDLAEGRLTLISSECSMELVVSIEAGELEDPVVVGVEDRDEDVDTEAPGEESSASEGAPVDEEDCG